jgi:hypothetical protein
VTAAEGDAALLVELGGLLARLDPMPPEVLDQARRLFCWRSVDVELAELAFDSLLDREVALAVRSGEESILEPRMLGFDATVDGTDLSIEVEVSTMDGQCTMIGQLSPAGADTISVQGGDGHVVDVPVDEVGRFLLRPVPSGPVRLRVVHAGHAVQTTWVTYAS